MDHGAFDIAELEEAAAKEALRVGLSLERNAGALTLTDGRMSVQADFARLAKRASPQNLTHELLVRAARIKGIDHPTAVDATAGLGDDSFLLAAAGFEVRLHERNPVIAALLADAMQRVAFDPAISHVIARMTLSVDDSVQALKTAGKSPDVVLLDPMFPERRKHAAVKKKLQLLQLLEQPCEDEEAMLEAAFAARPRKVVVKRPSKGPYLAGRKPDYSIDGKAVRFDCFALTR